MELDLRMLLSVAIAAVVMAIVFHFQARSFPQSIKGIQHWSWAFGLLSAGMLLAAARGWLPDLLSLVVGPLLVELALLFFYGGLCLLQARPTHYGWMAVPVAVNALSLVYFIYVEPLLWARVAVNSISNCLLTLPSLYLVIQGRKGDPKARFSKIYTAVVMLAIVCVCALRGGWAVVKQAVAAPEVTAALNQVLAVFYPTIVIVFAVGLMLTAFDRLKDELEYLVSHDSLTGTYSRRGFLSLAESEISRALRTQRHVALLVLDLDYFKQVNDRFGHPAGDLVLCKFAEVTRTCLRREDLFGRFGGEEFMVLLPDTQPQAARVVAERIRTAISASRVTGPTGQNPIRFTVSIGVATAAGRGTLDELLRSADAAMYQAKSRGRNRVEVV